MADQKKIEELKRALGGSIAEARPVAPPRGLTKAHIDKVIPMLKQYQQSLKQAREKLGAEQKKIETLVKSWKVDWNDASGDFVSTPTLPQYTRDTMSVAGVIEDEAQKLGYFIDAVQHEAKKLPG